MSPQVSSCACKVSLRAFARFPPTNGVLLRFGFVTCICENNYPCFRATNGAWEQPDMPEIESSKPLRRYRWKRHFCMLAIYTSAFRELCVITNDGITLQFISSYEFHGKFMFALTSGRMQMLRRNCVKNNHLLWYLLQIIIFIIYCNKNTHYKKLCAKL